MVWLSYKSFWEINTLSAGMPLTPNLLESSSTRGSPKGTASQLPAVKGLWIPYLGCSWNFSLFHDTVFTKSIKHYHKDRYGFWGNLGGRSLIDWKQLPNIQDFHEGLTMSLFHIIHLSRFTAVWRHKDPLHLVAFDSIFQSKWKKKRAGYLLLHLAPRTCPRVAVRPGWVGDIFMESTCALVTVVRCCTRLSFDMMLRLIDKESQWSIQRSSRLATNHSNWHLY